MVACGKVSLSLSPPPPPTCSLLQIQRESTNPYTVRKRGWNQVPPRDVLLPERLSLGLVRRMGGSEGVDEEEGPDLLVPFPLLSGIALAGGQLPGRLGRGRMGIGELREMMRELHAKASKSVTGLRNCSSCLTMILLSPSPFSPSLPSLSSLLPHFPPLSLPSLALPFPPLLLPSLRFPPLLLPHPPPRSELPETLVCVLCEPTGVCFGTPRELLDHIHSRAHMMRERRLWDDRQAKGLINELQIAGAQPAN